MHTEKTQQEHYLLDLEAPTVEDINSTQMQIRDAIHHFILENDQYGRVAVGVNDIMASKEVTTPLRRLGGAEEMTVAVRNAFSELLRAMKIAKHGTVEPPTHFVSIRTNIL